MTAHALMIAAPMLGLIGLGVATVGLFGRDPHADEHDLVDYRPAIAAARRNWPVLDVDTPAAALDAVPADEPPVPWRPPYAELTVAQVTRRYGDNPADIAARWLREAGERARAELELAR